MRFVFFLGPFCEWAPPAGGGGENLFPGDYDYIRQGRGHNVCLAVSRDGAGQAVDVCFDLTAAPAGDFSLAFDGKQDAACRRPHRAVRLCPSR